MEAKVFLEKLEEIFKMKTIYGKGCIGTPVTYGNVKSMQNMYPDWWTDEKIESRFKPIYGKNYFSFDCNGLIKAVIWGFDGSSNSFRGGAKYETNGLKDFSVSSVSSMKDVADLKTDFSSIEKGEVLFTPGHIGVYVGNGLCIESTCGELGNGVVKTCVSNIGTVNGYGSRKWSYHGKLKCVDYTTSEDGSGVNTGSNVVSVCLPVLKKGDKTNYVKTMQTLLLSKGYDLKQYGADGSFGGVTQTAINKFQEDKSISENCVVGEKTWNELLK